MKKVLLSMLLPFVVLGIAGARTLTVGTERGNYSSIQRALDAAGDGDVIFISAGTYDVDSPLTVSGKRNLSIEGDGSAEIVSQSIYDDILVFEDCTNIILSGVGAYHAETEDCSGFVLVLSGCKNFTVENCYLAGCGSVGIEINYSTNVTIDGNSIYYNSWTGINVGEENKGISITNNGFEGNYQNVLIEGEDYTEFEGTAGPVTMEANYFSYGEGMYPGDYENYEYGDLFYPEATDDAYYFAEVDFTAFYNDKEAVSGRTLTVGKTGGQYNSIQRAVDQARNGDTVRILGGEYLIDQPIRVAGKKKVIIEGVDSVSIVLSDSYENVFNLEESGSITLRNVSARHRETEGCWSSVVNIYHVRNVVIENCELNGSGQVGINLLGRCDELTVRNCYIHDNSIYAAYLYMYTGQLNFENNIVELNGGPLEIHDEDYYFSIFESGDLDLLEEQLGLEGRGFYFSGNDIYNNGAYNEYDEYGGAAQ